MAATMMESGCWFALALLGSLVAVAIKATAEARFEAILVTATINQFMSAVPIAATH